MTVSGELCCVALLFCCVVVVALPFSASLGVIVPCTILGLGFGVLLVDYHTLLLNTKFEFTCLSS